MRKAPWLASLAVFGVLSSGAAIVTAASGLQSPGPGTIARYDYDAAADPPLRVHYADGTVIDVGRERGPVTLGNRVERTPQVTFEDIKISPDRQKIGWVAGYTVCAQSYPWPIEVVVLRRGITNRHFRAGISIVTGWCLPLADPEWYCFPSCPTATRRWWQSCGTRTPSVCWLETPTRPNRHQAGLIARSRRAAARASRVAAPGVAPGVVAKGRTALAPIRAGVGPSAKSAPEESWFPHTTRAARRTSWAQSRSCSPGIPSRPCAEYRRGAGVARSGGHTRRSTVI